MYYAIWDGAVGKVYPVQLWSTILLSNIATLNQNIVELANVLTLIHACNPTGTLSQNK